MRLGEDGGRREAPLGSFVELRVQMYLAYNRSLHPSLPLVMMVRSVLCACLQPVEIYPIGPTTHFTPGSFTNEC